MHPLTIDADVGEVPSGVPAALRAAGALVRVSQLGAADYLVADEIGIERKSVLDLHRSIEGARLWSQLRAYRASLARLYLVVEGEKLDDGPISNAGVRGALLEIGDRGVTVIRTVDRQDSAEWIVRVAIRAQRRHELPRPRARRYKRRAEPADIVAAIPGVGARKARALLSQFGSVAAIATADSQELQRVPGIGPTLATTIHNAMW